MYDENMILALFMFVNSQKLLWETLVFDSLEEDNIDIDDIIDMAEAADADDVDAYVAQALAGIIYLYGIRVHSNNDKAVKWLKKAAKHGNEMGEYFLGICYACGLGVEFDIDEAMRWVRKSKKHGIEAEMADPLLLMLEQIYDQ